MIEIFCHVINKTGKGGCGFLATHDPKNSYIEISTAPCSEQDQYSKKVAVALLRQIYSQGLRIRLPIPSNQRRKMTHGILRNIVEHIFTV